MLVRDLTKIIEDLAPLAYQEEYDNAGLVCGNADAEIHSALLCLDITEEVIDEAIQGNHDIIISHHPLIFSGIKNIRPENYVNRCLIKAIKHDINLYAAHTNLDAVLQGVNGKIAEKIGLSYYQILRPQDGEKPTGSGIIGELANEEAAFHFLARIKDTFNCGVIRHTAIHKEQIKRIAVCGGSGSFLIKDAIAAKADVFITGDLKYHEFFKAEDKIILADIGHYESEQFTKEVFYNLLTKKNSNFAVQFSRVKTNPIKYL